MALGVAALITIVSVMNGFQKEMRTRILGIAAHVQINGAGNVLKNWQQVAAEAATHSQVTATAPYIMAQGLLAYEQQVQGTIVRGVLPEHEEQILELSKHIKSGQFNALRPGEYGIVLGSELARGLGVKIGDKVTVIAPQGQVTPAGILPRLKQFRVVATFEIGYYQYDSSLALIHLEDAKKLYRIAPSDVSGVTLRLKDVDQARKVARELVPIITADAYIADWTRLNSTLFRAIEIEKTVMFVILTLIIAVAAFNIVATLVMAVTDKQADIAILRTLGASPLSILKIFMVQGAMIGVVGTLLGVIGGSVLAINIDVVVPFIQNLFGVEFLAKDVYQISDMPSELRARDVIITVIVSLSLSLLATIYPSLRAARVNPAEALRYE